MRSLGGLGLALSGDGNTILMGAPGRKITKVQVGRAYVFKTTGNAWAQVHPVLFLEIHTLCCNLQFGNAFNNPVNTSANLFFGISAT